MRFASGLEMAVTPEKFLVKMGGGAVAVRRQLPLRLAWAISVHKSQVCIYDVVYIEFTILARYIVCLGITIASEVCTCRLGDMEIMGKVYMGFVHSHVDYNSQGMTLDCVEISLGRAFEDGQAYVALSRARSLQCMRVTDFQPSCVRAHAAVLEYYRSLRRMRRNFIQ